MNASSSPWLPPLRRQWVPKECEKSQQEFKIPNLAHITSKQKPKVGKMTLGMGAPKEHNYTHVPTIQPSTFNHQHSPSLQDEGSVHRHENFEELPQTHQEPFQHLT